ncbi:arylamine N-acetyltransferase family protein [Aspergillus lucknowensis]|uniref:Arylamine N-acetyltransferase n=1 Tax=Aspergillus lucknowensis TaxID=176173 RepID=A0ABR4LZ78_9EURO
MGSDFAVGESAYSTDQITAWLEHIRLPTSYSEYIENPAGFPKTFESLRALMRCQISRFPYENLSVHYSPTHLVDIDPHNLYEKLMGPERIGRRGRGGYCMELSIFFHHMLRGLGFQVYMTAVRNRGRKDGVPGGEYLGFTHINNIIHLPSGKRFSVDVGFGGDGPTSPLSLDEQGRAVQNLGRQEVRLIHDNIPKQKLKEPKLWIYQYRNAPENDWNSFYSFAELEFFQHDFEVLNWWTSAKTLHRWTVLVVRFLRDGEDVQYSRDPDLPLDNDVKIVGKVMLVDTVVKVNLGGKTSTVHSFDSEEGRLHALKVYFGISLTQEETQSIRGWDKALD